MHKRAEELEEQIASKEEEIRMAELALSDFVSVEDAQSRSALIEDQRRQLDELMAEWETISQQVAEAVEATA